MKKKSALALGVFQIAVAIYSTVLLVQWVSGYTEAPSELGSQIHYVGFIVMLLYSAKDWFGISDLL